MLTADELKDLARKIYEENLVGKMSIVDAAGIAGMLLLMVADNCKDLKNRQELIASVMTSIIVTEQLGKLNNFIERSKN